MWVTEHAAKLLLAEAGVAVPGGAASSCDGARVVAAALGYPLYVKALVARTDRAAAGGVRRVSGPTELTAAVDACRALGADEVRLEVPVEDGPLWYVAVGWFPPDERPHALFSTDGGSGIEGRAESIARIPIDPAVGPLPHHVRALTRGRGVERGDQGALLDLLQACFRLLWSVDATLVELNPVAPRDGALVAVDARVVVDSSSTLPRTDPRLVGAAGRNGGGLEADLAAHGIAYVGLGGTVGVAGLGAGLTLHLADWVRLAGAEPAFFFDATEAAVLDWAPMFAGEVPREFAAALAYGLSRTIDGARCLLVNFTSGGTPVDGLVRGLLEARRDGFDWDGHLVVHAAGNSAVRARELLAEAGIDAPPTLGAAVRRAVELGRPVAA